MKHESIEYQVRTFNCEGGCSDHPQNNRTIVRLHKRGKARPFTPAGFFTSLIDFVGIFGHGADTKTRNLKRGSLYM
jgi:hypothetical protein